MIDGRSRNSGSRGGLLRKPLTLTAVVAVLLLAFAILATNLQTASAVTNLITNGGFETGTTSSWSVTSGDVDVVPSSGWQPSEGNFSLDLNGFFPGTISQSFGTVPGQSYQLLFDLAGNPGNGGVVTVQVSVGNQTVTFTFDTAGHSTNNMGWVGKTLNFTAAASTSTLQFKSLTTGPLCLNGLFAACGPTLDNIRVFQNNTPPTLSANSASVTTNEGTAASNNGTYTDVDPANNVAITASIGTVTKTGTNSGTWSWSFSTTDGPSQSQTVTITANDGNGGVSTTSFGLTVNNVAPSLTVNVGASNTVFYVNWTAANPAAGTASGVINLPNGSTVNVTFDALNQDGTHSSYFGAQTNGGTNYWIPSAPYISAEVPNAPPDADILQLSGGSNTIYKVTLSQPIVDPIMAIVSLGAPFNTITYNFDSPFAIVSQGVGFFGGCSTCLKQLPGNVLQGTEGHGTIKFLGTFATFSWTVPKNEVWHGFTFAIRTTNQLGNINVNEGDTATNSGTWSDPGVNDNVVLTASVGTVTKNANGTWNWSFNTTDGPAQTQTVTITATDKDGASTSKQFPLTVKNVAPSNVSLTLSAASINENDSTTLSGTFTDPGVLDTHTVVINWGDGSATTTLNLAAGVLSFSASHQYLDDNPTGTPSDVYSISVTVTDKDGGAGNGSASITVNNVAPVITSVTPSATTIPFGGTLNLNAAFTDVGTLDTHTATIDWGDGSPVQNVAVAESNGSGSLAAGHQYFQLQALGAHTITVSVTDDDGGKTSATTTVTVVSTPGKITGGVLRFGNNGRGGFNVQSNNGVTVKGELEYHNGSVNLHAHTLTAIAVSPDHTKGWFAGILDDGRTFVAYVEDNGEPGKTDVFKMWVEGTLLNDGGVLTGGNIQIHKSP